MGFPPESPDIGAALSAPAHVLLHGPIQDLSLLEKSLLFAEVANLCYFSRGEAGILAYNIGFPEIRFYERDGAQAYIFANEYDAVVVCRGTEPHDWNDIRANVDTVMAVGEAVGRVHRGFKQEADDLWPRLEQALLANTRTLWFTGHSLGGALVAICAGRCQLSYIRSAPTGLFTYGSPRIGNRSYVNSFRMPAYRWVNNNDIVTRVPPRWAGYRHVGQVIYIDSRGRIPRLSASQRRLDRWQGFLHRLRRGKLDHFEGHAIGNYIAAIRNTVEVDSRAQVLRVIRGASEAVPSAIGKDSTTRAA